LDARLGRRVVLQSEHLRVTHRDDEKDVLYVVEEPPGKCELCGAVKVPLALQTWPVHDPPGKWMCPDCGKPQLHGPGSVDHRHGEAPRGFVVRRPL
jgi:hypothetical protein